VALFLSALGLYGVLAYHVTQRTREIGIRVALGGTRAAIHRIVLREGVILVASGLALGVLGAAAATRALEAELFGIQATDPGVVAAAVVLLAGVGLAACGLPARRATRIDPVRALAD
jgi:ABC-type antimicrobial peptide transport system permease subunit